MSFVVLSIAAAHSLPPILGAMLGKSKGSLWVGVFVAVFVALISGKLAFVAFDLLGVALGWWVGLSILDKRPD